MDLSSYTDTDFQVWVETPQGGRYAYRTGLIWSVAKRWAEAWNSSNPQDVQGATFHVVKATTTYTEEV